mmetsp:Transcript_78177/g.234298  ORF Transcript_78177/g.234298 Transcript_78177/m.234298 type:complete len:212 (+) Transcript_78177:134-769(+)
MMRRSQYDSTYARIQEGNCGKHRHHEQVLLRIHPADVAHHQRRHDRALCVLTQVCTPVDGVVRLAQQGGTAAPAVATGEQQQDRSPDGCCQQEIPTSVRGIHKRCQRPRDVAEKVVLSNGGHMASSTHLDSRIVEVVRQQRNMHRHRCSRVGREQQGFRHQVPHERGCERDVHQVGKAAWLEVAPVHERPVGDCQQHDRVEPVCRREDYGL